MGEIINLRNARKQLARAAHERQSGENRVKFGRSKVEKTLTEAERARAKSLLDGHQRDDEKP
jgi:hypothetical protein